MHVASSQNHNRRGFPGKPCCSSQRCGHIIEIFTTTWADSPTENNSCTVIVPIRFHAFAPFINDIHDTCSIKSTIYPKWCLSQMANIPFIKSLCRIIIRLLVLIMEIAVSDALYLSKQLLDRPMLRIADPAGVSRIPMPKGLTKKHHAPSKGFLPSKNPLKTRKLIWKTHQL